MDIVITIIGWMVGLYVAFMLILAIGFSAGGAANNKNSDLSIMSIGSTLLLIYLIYKGFTFLFGADETDGVSRKVSLVVQAVQYDTTETDVSSSTAPALKVSTIPTQVEKKSQVHKQPMVVKEKKDTFTNSQYILWFFYAFAFIYAVWLLKPSKGKHTEKELAKKKLIASMMFKKDASGLQAWHPDWKPEDHL